MNHILRSLGFLILLTASSLGQSGDPEIFLKGIPSGFQTVDMDHDEDGNTYVLGNRGGTGVIVKYDSSGNTNADENIVMTGFQAVALDVVGRAPGGAIYVASASAVRKYSLAGDLQFSDPTSLSNVTDVAFSSATNQLFLAIQTPGIAPIVQVRNADAGFQRWMVFGNLGWTNATVRSLTVDDQGAVYLVGETGIEAGTWDPWASFGPPHQSGSLSANTRYLAKVTPELDGYTSHQPGEFASLFNVHFNNGWIYLMGRSASTPTDALRVQRRDTDLADISRQLVISNGDYATLVAATPGKMRKFGIAADALDNVYLTGYLANGSTRFFPHGTTSEEFRSVASTGESAFVAKLDSEFDYQWVKTPIQAPLPAMGTALRASWDGKNSRLWWSGSFQGENGITMQEGADASSAKTLPFEIGSWQGFTAVFEPDGAFTEVVDFTLDTDYAENRVLLNGSPLQNPGTTLSLILDSNLEIKSPRTVYQWDGAPEP
ncbi:MAG TPA: hypothetical protein VLO11_15010, partial [Luteolibacter sp.]|nr:hypothetical protein [Luteolibacter sp.]